MTAITEALDRVFAHADEIIDSLGDEFTSQQFLRRVIDGHETEYNRLLIACGRPKGDLGLAHRMFGKRLAQVMTDYGYIYETYSNQATNVLGNTTSLTIYRKAK